MKRSVAIWLPGGVGGGYYSQGHPPVAGIVEALSKEFDITVYSLYPSNPDYRPPGFKLFSGRNVRWFGWLALCFLFLWNHWSKKYEVLYAFWGFPAGFFAVLFAKVLSLPSIVHLQGGDAVCLRPIRYGVLCNVVYKKLATWTYLHATELVVLSRFQLRCVEAMGITRYIHVIPFGVDCSEFSFRDFDYNKQRELRCLHIGNVTPVKDQITLLKTFKVLTQNIAAKLRIVGTNANDATLGALCKHLGISDHVEFFDPRPHKALRSFYAWADLFLLTSLYEGQGVVILEAAASGNLLAGTATGILADLGTTCAILVQPRDFEGLANGILRTIDNPSRIRQMTANASAWARKYDVNWNYSRIERLLRK